MKNDQKQQLQQEPEQKKEFSKLLYFFLWLISLVILTAVMNYKNGIPFFNTTFASRGIAEFGIALAGILGSMIGAGVLGFLVSFVVCSITKKWRNMESVFLGAMIFNIIFLFVLF